MNNPDSENVVTKSITVAIDVEQAFRIWTEQIDVWWPAGHSLSGDPETRVFIEGKVGGRFYEQTPKGDEYVWGAVEVWEPPNRLAFTWYLGSSPALPTRVEVIFVLLDKHKTRLEIEHRGPELIGELWGLTKARYSAAWDKVLLGYGAYCPSD